MDQVIQHRVMSMLAEMGLSSPISLIDDFDQRFSIRNFGEFRLYEFHLEIRDDVDIDNFEVTFSEILADYNEISSIKIAYIQVNRYPGPVKNWTTVYLTVAAI